jgi:hypothetical protein
LRPTIAAATARDVGAPEPRKLESVSEREAKKHHS